MADKSFGVKELNLLNASGTPTVTSPNNLNLNATTVAISTSCTIGSNLTVSGDIDVDGHTNLDNVSVAGVSTFADDITVQKNMHFGDSPTGTENLLSFGAGDDLNIFHSGNGSFIRDSGTGSLTILTNQFLFRNAGNNEELIEAFENSSVSLFFNGTKRFETTNTGAVVTGILTATTFSGSGASLTNLPLADSDIQVLYTVTANGSSAYRFAGNGVVSTADNPDLHLIRGQKYRFVNNSGGSHPFQIRVSSGGSAYNTGVTNNGASSGNIDFAPTFDSPAQLVYQCTSHGGMVGNIYIHGAGGGRGILTQNTTLTGSSMTFDNIPTWATKITVNLLEASLSGSDQIYVRLRAGSSSITSDYSSVSGNFQGNIISSKTDAFNINGTGGTQLHSGSMVIEKIDSAGLKYIQTHMVLTTNGNSRHGGGNLERSSGAAVDGIEITVEGSNTYDGGTVAIYYE